MKNFIISALIVLLLLGAFWFSNRDHLVPVRDPDAIDGNLKAHTNPALAEAPTAMKSSRSRLQESQVSMTAVENKIDFMKPNSDEENAPFRFIGGAGTGRVIDRQGNVILESSEDRGIFGAVVGPDGEKVLVDAANPSGGNCVVLIPSLDQRIDLPSRPPSRDMFSFRWDWLGPNLLLGASGIQKSTHDGTHENSSGDDNVAQTKLYTFDLLTKKLSEVTMPSAVTQPVVHIRSVTSDGHVNLGEEGAHDGSEQDLGWFQIDATGAK